MRKMTQTGLVKEYFVKNPNRDIPHPDVVDWVVAEYKKRTGKVFRDPDRMIRSLYASGFLIKVAKGVYKHDPKFVSEKKLHDFTPEQKREILEKGNYQCAVCGEGIASGVELHVDHIKPRDQDGESVVSNGQVLCGQHNYRKHNLGQTEMAKKMFVNLYNKSKADGEEEIVGLCIEVLEVYERRGINGHIKWKR